MCYSSLFDVACAAWCSHVCSGEHKRKVSLALLMGNRMISSRRAAALGTAAAALLVLASASRPVFDEVKLTCVLLQDETWVGFFYCT